MEDRRIGRVRDHDRRSEVETELRMLVEAELRLEDRGVRERAVQLADASVGAVVEAAIGRDRSIHSVHHPNVVARETEQPPRVEVERVEEACAGAARDPVRLDVEPASTELVRQRANELIAASRRWRCVVVEYRDVRAASPGRSPLHLGADRPNNGARCRACMDERGARLRPERQRHGSAMAVRHTASKRCAYSSTDAWRRIVSRADEPIALADPGSASTARTDVASASGSAGGTNTMFSPSRSSSGAHNPRVRERTTGRAHAIACRVTLWPDGCGTSRTGTTTAAAFRYTPRTSSSLSSRRYQSAASHVTFAGNSRGGRCRVRSRTLAGISGAAAISVAQSRCPSLPIATTSPSLPPPGDQNVASTPNATTCTRFCSRAL